MLHSAESLADEGAKLLALEIDDLYIALGAQLLGQSLPAKVAGLVSYLSALRKAYEAMELDHGLPSPFSPVGIGNGLRAINDALREDGKRYFTEVSEELRNALCKNDLRNLAEGRGSSTMVGIMIVIVGAALRIPREFDAISVTVAAIVLKLGLADFCAAKSVLDFSSVIGRER
jgi:hypothetical protein